MVAPRWLAASLALAPVCLAGAQSREDAARAAYSALASRISSKAIEARVRRIADIGSRLAGSDGERRALEYAESEFRRMGLRNVRREPFFVTVPNPEAVGSVAGDGWSAGLLPLWPNLVRTSTCDIAGPAIYGGDGSLRALEGKAVRGTIVLLEFSSGANWTNAAKLGARAILFIEPPDAERSIAEQLFSGLPHDLPRFWLPLSRAAPVLEAAFAGSVVRVRCRQDWVVRKTFNVLGDAPGSDRRAQDERLLLSAYADAMSVVPGSAPGADASCGLAALLELAAIARGERWRRPITFMASAAHGLALGGERAFVDRRLRSDRERYLATVNLDISSGSASLGSFAMGWYYDYRVEAFDAVRPVSRALRQHADRIASTIGDGARLFVDAVNDSDGRTWRNNIPGAFAMSCEPFLQARYNALSFCTIEDGRQRHDTPFDLVPSCDFDNVARQVRTSICLFWHLANDSSDPRESSGFKVALQPQAPRGMSLVGGFGVLEGRVVRFDPARSFTADVSVPSAIAVLRHGAKTLMGVRAPTVQLAEGPQSRYRIVGAPPINSWDQGKGFPVRLAAFGVDPKTGAIRFAANEGLLGEGAYDWTFALKTSRRSTPLVVFGCSATSLFDLVDPHGLAPLNEARVLDGTNNAEPRHFGIFLPGWEARFSSEVESSAVLFAEPGSRWKLLMGSGLGEVRLSLTGASSSEPAGRGYLASASSVEGVAIQPGIPARAATDMLLLNQSRLERFRKYGIVSPSIERLQAHARAELDSAMRSAGRREWAAAERQAFSSWGYALRAYPVIQGTALDVVIGVVFYLFLLIPFSYFLERLLFASKSLLRQIAWSLAIFVGGFLALRVLHPAFEIVADPSMILVAFVMGSLSVVVAGFVFGKFESALKLERALLSGVRELDVGRVGVAAAAFGLGVGNMRRRKARTVLTTATLAMMTFIVLGFTSIVPDLQLNEVPSDVEPRYAGILFRNPGLDPMPAVTYRLVANHFDGRGAVARRAWFYGADIGANSLMAVRSSDRSATVRAVLGLDAAERRATGMNAALLPGGRWFREREVQAAILPSSLARALRIGAAQVGRASVAWMGQRFVVVGILDDHQLRSAVDLDGDGLLPADFALSSKLQMETRTQVDTFRKYLRVDVSHCLILTAEAALRNGADIRSIAVGLSDGSRAREELRELMPRMRLNLYGSVASQKGLEVRMFSIRQGSKSTGLGLVLVQLLIASVFVLSTMVSSVYERTREIGIFSAIGLAPNHIAVLFLAESMVYGVLGSVIGYFLAQSVASVVLATGWLPGLFLNFSASSALLSGGLVFGVVLLSTLYPARVAARIAAPALEQQLMPDEPAGDSWSATLPFSVATAEAEGQMRFVAEWLSAHEEYAIGAFVTSGTSSTRAGNTLIVESTVWVSPFDLGVSQRLRLSSEPTEVEDVCRVGLVLERLSGEPSNWVVVNRRFLGQLRRQFLAWRADGRGIRTDSGSLPTGGAAGPTHSG